MAKLLALLLPETILVMLRKHVVPKQSYAIAILQSNLAKENLGKSLGSRAKRRERRGKRWFARC
jgi:hypothetical protein